VVVAFRSRVDLFLLPDVASLFQEWASGRLSPDFPQEPVQTW